MGIKNSLSRHKRRLTAVATTLISFDKDYRVRSIPLATGNCFLDSGKRDCVATANVRRKLAAQSQPEHRQMMSNETECALPFHIVSL